MNRNNHGFTIVEIVVVLVLISIIAAAVFTRSITTDQINFVGQVEKIRNQIRYAQSLAMKRNETWGIKCDGNYYWLFNWKKIFDDKIAIKLPGEVNDKIHLSDLGITMNGYTLFFKKYGDPYQTSPNSPITTAAPLNINIASIDASQSMTLGITPNTGLLVTQ
jgi:prepilin-type N-terminal cleavage/methylation domain-containing protein